MPSISVKEFLIWEKKQLLKGGDHQSFAFLLDYMGGISNSDLNLLSKNLEGKLNLKKSIDDLEIIWNEHVISSAPIQYLSLIHI